MFPKSFFPSGWLMSTRVKIIPLTDSWALVLRRGRRCLGDGWGLLTRIPCTRRQQQQAVQGPSGEFYPLPVDHSLSGRPDCRSLSLVKCMLPKVPSRQGADRHGHVTTGDGWAVTSCLPGRRLSSQVLSHNARSTEERRKSQLFLGLFCHLKFI